MVIGPFAVLQTVIVAPEASTAVPRTATGPTLTPQMLAATWAATPMLALLSTLTSPTATLTSPFWVAVWAKAGVAG
jgi:hypothetical protein